MPVGWWGVKRSQRQWQEWGEAPPDPSIRQQRFVASLQPLLLLPCPQRMLSMACIPRQVATEDSVPPLQQPVWFPSLLTHLALLWLPSAHPGHPCPAHPACQAGLESHSICEGHLEPQ